MKIVIVTGITGINKSEFIDNFRKKAGIDDVSEVINFEQELINDDRKKHGGIVPTNITSFLNTPSTNDKAEMVRDTFSWIQKITSNNEYVFLNIHLTYYKNNEYFPPFDPEDYVDYINNINDDCAQIVVINLIDDAYNIWKSILDKDREDYPETKITLREVLGWRSLETLMSEALAKSLANRLYNEGDASNRQNINKNVESYMVSIRHPHSTFENLIKPKKPIRFYLSYPITEPRKDESMINVINNFRVRMHELGKKYNVAIFDPVTIDELLPHFNKPTEQGEEIIIKEDMRWPLGYNAAASQKQLPEIRMPRAQIEDGKKHIDSQISSRDYKLVEYSKAVVVFRPCFGGASEGVKKEITHAVNKSIQVLVYLPDDEKLGSGPFRDRAEIINDESKFYRRAEVLMEKYGANAYI